jgi:hypothetical protein
MIDRIEADSLAGLKEAAQLGLLIPFIGAGASRVAGCPGWPDFAERALRFFVEKGKFTHAQLDQIRTLNPRVKLSFAKILERQHDLQIDFNRVLYQSADLNNAKGLRLYSAIAKLGKTFVTTNYDEWLDSCLARPPLLVAEGPEQVATATQPTPNVIHRVRDLTPDSLSRPNTVIHLHGSLKEPGSMIVTTQDYIGHYANDRKRGGADEENPVLTFLHALFQTRKTVLFIGYGLEELEILEYVIGKAGLRQPAGDKQIRHYILQGFFGHEQELRRTLERYYRENGIGLIPFSRDERDWDQLIDEVEKLAQLMPAAELNKIERLIEMEALLNG